MHNRQLIDLAVAAKRWRDAQRRRLDACRIKRNACEAERATRPFHDPRASTACYQADAAVSVAKREERKALKALAKLCDQATPVEDVLTVDEVRELPRLETGSVA